MVNVSFENVVRLVVLGTSIARMPVRDGRTQCAERGSGVGDGRRVGAVVMVPGGRAVRCDCCWRIPGFGLSGRT
jgi:hypothetical protein